MLGIACLPYSKCERGAEKIDADKGNWMKYWLTRKLAALYLPYLFAVPCVFSAPLRLRAEVRFMRQREGA
jgi:hypothetical protein